MNICPLIAAIPVVFLLCAGLAQNTSAAGVTKINLLPPGPGNARNSEGDFIQLKDGRLLFIYSHFTSGGNDNSKAYLASRVSSDGGKTWSQKDDTVLASEDGLNVMSVSLLRLKNGKIALFYLKKTSINDCRPMMRISGDEGKTWGKPVCCINDHIGYYVVNNDRVIQLSSGRLVIPAALHISANDGSISPGVAMCYLSDDNGKTWRRSSEIQPLKESASGLQEPLVVELKDRKLMMLARSDQGCQLRSWSVDGGLTWSVVERTNIISPVSPATVKRVPKIGDLLLIWNNHENIDSQHAGKRTPLNAAVSKDEGRTWQNVKTIEDDSNGWYCYTALEFVGNRVLLGYCASEPPIGQLQQTRISYFDLQWLYR